MTETCLQTDIDLSFCRRAVYIAIQIFYCRFYSYIVKIAFFWNKWTNVDKIKYFFESSELLELCFWTQKWSNRSEIHILWLITLWIIFVWFTFSLVYCFFCFFSGHHVTNKMKDRNTLHGKNFVDTLTLHPYVKYRTASTLLQILSSTPKTIFFTDLAFYPVALSCWRRKGVFPKLLLLCPLTLRHTVYLSVRNVFMAV